MLITILFYFQPEITKVKDACFSHGSSLDQLPCKLERGSGISTPRNKKKGKACHVIKVEPRSPDSSVLFNGYLPDQKSEIDNKMPQQVGSKLHSKTLKVSIL